MLDNSDYLYQTLSNESFDLSNYVTPVNSPFHRLNASLYRTCPRTSSPLNDSLSESIDLASLNLDSGQSSAFTRVDGNGNSTSSIENSSSATLVPIGDKTAVNTPESSKLSNNQINYDSPGNYLSKLEDAKLSSLVTNLIKMNSDLNHIELFEQQISNLSFQVRMMKENLIQQNVDNIALVQQIMSKSNNNPPDTQDAGTQTIAEKLELPTVNDNFKFKFQRLSALVKGYLVRRLARTERVIDLKRTIRDTSIILLNFKETNLTKDGKLVVTHQDILLHMRLCNQLEKACMEFYSIFITLPTDKRMRLIAQDRLYLREMQERRSVQSARSLLTNSSFQSSHLSNSLRVHNMK